MNRRIMMSFPLPPLYHPKKKGDPMKATRLFLLSFYVAALFTSIAFFGMKTKAEPKAALPVVTFTKDVTFHINGDEVHAYHAANAHTDGDAIVHFRNSDVIHMGDTFFNKMYPFIDTSSGGKVDGMIEAAERVLAIAGDNTQIIPGHGTLANKTDLKAYRDMLATVSARIKAQIKDGKTLEEVLAANPTAEFDEVWGKGFLSSGKWVEMMHENLKMD